MSLFALIDLFIQYRRLFVGTVLIACTAGLVFFSWQPERYRLEVLLSLTRTAIAESPDYTYDEYYRLQADEKMTDTLVAYLMSYSGKRTVAERAHLSGESYRHFVESALRVGRKGANLLIVEYMTYDREQAMRVGDGLLLAANAQLSRLNEDARDPTWFTVMSEEPVIERAMFGPLQLLLLSVGVGSFLGFWTVLLVHFWRGYSEYRRGKL